MVLVCVTPPQCSGGQGIARARRDLSNAVGSAQIHAGLSKSMWRGRGPGAGRFVRDLGPLPLCVALLVQANRNHTSHRDLGPTAESTPGPPEAMIACRDWLVIACDCM